MTRGIVLILLLAGAAPAAAQSAAAAAAASVGDAEAAIDTWLAVAGGSRCQDGWRRAGALFRESWPERSWETACDVYRDQLRRGSQRRVIAVTQREDPPILPGFTGTVGRYVVIRYATTLDRYRTVYEEVTAASSDGGPWEVAAWSLWPNVRGDPVLAAPAPAPLAETPPPPPAVAPAAPAAPAAGLAYPTRPAAAPARPPKRPREPGPR